MLKTNNKTYLLLVAVLGIWGTIGYKIINGLSDDDVEYKTEEIGAFVKPDFNQKIDSFSIASVEKDPFLGTIRTSKRKSVKSAGIKKQNNPKPAIAITYQGQVKQQGTSKSIFILTINNKQHLVKQGQTVDGVKIISGNAKDVVVRYDGKTQTISL